MSKVRIQNATVVLGNGTETKIRVGLIHWPADISFCLIVRSNLQTTADFTKGGVELGHPHIKRVLLGTERVERISEDVVRVHFDYIGADGIKYAGAMVVIRNDLGEVDSTDMGIIGA